MPLTSRHSWSAALAIAITVLASSARANGRFPRAERVRELPGDASTLTLAGTYGLLTTHDHGHTWFQVCEPEFSGQMSYVGDPLFEYTQAGTALVGVQTTLNRSTDLSCTWSPVLGGTQSYVPDYTSSASEPGRVLALTSTLEDGGLVARVAESLDDGATFHALGTALPASALTIEVPASAPERIYVSGLSPQGEGLLMVSTDRGTTWSTQTIAGTGTDEPPYIAGVMPNDADQIFVRTDSQSANDALLVSADAGAHFREIYRAQAKILGFALSPDGTSVLIGYGDPVDPTISVDPDATGAFLADTSSFAFARVFSGSVTCLTWTANGVYVCTPPMQTGFALAQSSSPELADAGALVPLLHLNEVRGPLTDCPVGAVTACVSAWPVACSTFGACKQDAGTADSGGTAGVGGGNGSSGAGVAVPDASTTGGAGSSVMPNAGAAGVHITQGVRSPGACGCRVEASTRTDSTRAAWLVALLASSAIRRRRLCRRARAR